MMKLILSSILLTLGMSQLAAAKTVTVVKKGHDDRRVISIDLADEERFDERDYNRYIRHNKFDHKGHHYANRKLRQRVRQLEKAVLQLQEEIFFMQNNRYDEDNYACVLNAGTRGMYVGKAGTKVEAEALAFQKCAKKQGNFMCKGSPVRCETES